MGKYLKKFENHNDYETYIISDDKILPNISYCFNNKDVHYNPKPIDYSKKYFTFKALENSEFTFVSTNNTINYSLDNGANWNTLESGESTPVVTAGNKILWKSTCVPIAADGTGGIGKFQATGDFDIEGNAMSLLYGDEFKR